MRVIKFRWFIRRAMQYRFEGFREDMCINEMFNYCNDENYNTMQYTGLKDKLGKEIYEGDIMHDSEPHCEDCYDGKSVVIFDEKTGSYQFNNTNLFDRLYYSYTIIGNIYENPELIERKE